MSYNFLCKRFIKRKIRVNGEHFKAFKLIKPEDPENLKKISKHDKRTY